jgi:ribosomal-protein-alanine N-acetyltransferase
MRLEVRQDNSAAIRLYERLGYRRFAARQGYYEDGEDAWRYEKKLRPLG